MAPHYVRKKVTPHAVIETTYSATICTLAEAGAGIGVVNPYIASVFADRLRIAPLRPALKVQVMAAHPRHLAMSSLTSAFLRLLSEHFDMVRSAPLPSRGRAEPTPD